MNLEFRMRLARDQKGYLDPLVIPCFVFVIKVIKSLFHVCGSIFNTFKKRADATEFHSNLFTMARNSQQGDDLSIL
jgi:hypothetical protein